MTSQNDVLPPRIRFDGREVIKSPRLSDLTPSTLAVLQRKTELDTYLYQQIKTQWDALVANQGFLPPVYRIPSRCPVKCADSRVQDLRLPRRWLHSSISLQCSGAFASSTRATLPACGTPSTTTHFVDSSRTDSPPQYHSMSSFSGFNCH
jgi:hypothetical protein